MKKILSILLALAIFLSLQPGISWAADSNTITMTGTGTAADPYQIGTAAQLVEFRKLVNGGACDIHAVLTADIVFNPGVTITSDDNNNPLANGQPASGLEQWIPIGLPNGSLSAGDFLTKGWYTGTFDGKGHTISGLYCDYQSEVAFQGMSAATLFTALGEGGVVKNVGVVNSYFRGEAASAIVGAVQGTVDSCYSDAFVVGLPRDPESKSTNAFSGGIAAAVVSKSAKINRCAFFGFTIGLILTETDENQVETVTHQYGGIVGTNGYIILPGTDGYKNNYYINTIDAEQPKGCNEVSLNDISSGKLAYDLNKSATGQMYYQNIDQEPLDQFPGFDASHGTVYRVKNCRGRNTYSNTNDTKGHVYGSDGKCVVCATPACMSWTVDGRTVFFENAQDAFSEALGLQGEIKLYSDASLTEAATLTSGVLTLNLNSFTLYGGVDVYGAAVTLTGKGQINGNVTVTSGALYVQDTKITASEGYAIEVVEGAVEIYGGEFIGGEEQSVKLCDGTILFGGKYHGLNCDVALENLIAIDDGYAAFTTAGEKLDMTQTFYTQTLEIKLGGNDPEQPTGPSEEPTEPSEEPTGPSEEPTEPSEEPTEPSEEPTGPSEEPTDPSDNWPEPPVLDQETFAVIEAPKIGNNIVYQVLNDINIILDVDPLMGISRDELIGAMTNPELEAWDVKYVLPAVSKLRTSDRLTIQVSEDGKILSEKTYVIVILGDLNCDGMAMANDAALMVKLESNPGNTAPEIFAAADLNRDGEIMANDAQRLIYRYYNYSQGYESALK